jgi:hypothetical protein
MADIRRQHAPVGAVEAAVTHGVLRIAVTGYKSDPAWSLEPPTYRVEGHTVLAEIMMSKPNGVMAACVIVDYAETIEIDVHEWASGDYKVVVNEIEANFQIS